jgi:pSer/pThr/pTyr-binding forkhead associated (FHA) protein
VIDLTCPNCGRDRDPARSLDACPHCGAPLPGGADAPGVADGTQPRAQVPVVMFGEVPLRLSLLDEEGRVLREFAIDREHTVVGRTTGDVCFGDDETLSPEHAVLTWKENALIVRDLGSANGSWLFITAPHVLTDGDVLLVGSQVIRFRRLPSRVDGAGRIGHVHAGSRLPVEDDAMLEQLRADGSVRDVLYLSPGRMVLLGRETGDWVFPYDPTMSGRHTEIRSNAARSEYTVRDLGSRNGVAVLVRGERPVRRGERLLLGRKMLRLDVT